MALSAVHAGLLLAYSTAAMAANRGVRRPAGMSALSTYVGSGWKLEFTRNATAVLRFVGAGSLPVVGNDIVITSSDIDSTELIADADIDTGTWLGKLTKADGTVMFTGTAGRSGTDFIFTDDVVEADGVTVSTITFTLPASIDAALGPAPGDIIPYNDPSTVYATDPTRAFDDDIWGVTAMGMRLTTVPADAAYSIAPDVALTTFGAQDPTILDYDGSGSSLGIKLARETHAGFNCFHHRVHRNGLRRLQNPGLSAPSRYDSDNFAWRASLQIDGWPGLSSTVGAITRGQTFLAIAGFKLNSDSVVLGSNGTGFLLWSYHHYNGGNGGTPLNLMLENIDGVAALRLSVQYMPSEYGNGILNGATQYLGGPNHVVRLWEETDLTMLRDNWFILAVEAKYTPDKADGAFVNAFLQMGDEPYEQIASLPGQPMCWASNTYPSGEAAGREWIYPQQQLYKYLNDDWQGVDTRSYRSLGSRTYRKGAGNINVANAFATMNALRV